MVVSNFGRTQIKLKRGVHPII